MTVREIAEGVYMLEGLGQAYLYQEADRLTLIDTGLADKARDVLALIEALGRRPADLRQIILTHYHIDHWAAAPELVDRTNAEVIAHGLDAQVVRGEAEEPEPLLSEPEREAWERITGDVPPVTRPARVDREVMEGDEIDLDSGARVVHVPGHTAGSIAVYVPRRKLMFAGDAAARMPDGQLIVGVFNVDPAGARRSFRKLAELDFEVACFGHGDPMDKEASLAFRRAVEKLGRE